MSDTKNVLPVKFVGESVFELLAIHFCIDWGGRQAQCEFQVKHGDHYDELSATYYALEGKWSKENWPTDDDFTRQIRAMFPGLNNDNNSSQDET